MTQPAVDIDPALRELAASGFSLLASEVAGLQPQKVGQGVRRRSPLLAQGTARPGLYSHSSNLVLFWRYPSVTEPSSHLRSPRRLSLCQACCGCSSAMHAWLPAR